MPKIGDLVLHKDPIEGDQIAEIIKIDPYSTMLHIEYARKDLFPRARWVRHHEIEVIDFSLENDNKVLTETCCCGMIKVDKKAPRRAHSTWCDMHKS